MITVAVFTLLIATVDLPASKPGLPGGAYWLAGSVTAAVLLLSVLVHEIAHALAAQHYGVGVGTMTLWMLGGSTTLKDEPPSARADATIAAAGPVASLSMATGFAAAAWAVGVDGLTGSALAWLAWTNLLLALFNLLPGAPLDGGRVLRALLWATTHDRERAAALAAEAGRRLGLLLVGIGLVELLFGFLAGAWLALVGWFILSGAEAERQTRPSRLDGLTVSDAMTLTPVVAPGWWTVDRFLGQLTPEAAHQPAHPLVDIDGRFTGVVTPAALERVRTGQTAVMCLQDIAVRPEQVNEASPDEALQLLLDRAPRQGALTVVVEDGRPVGVVTEADIARLVRLARSGWSGGPAHQPS